MNTSVYAASLPAHAFAPFVPGPENLLTTIRSEDGTLLAVECAGLSPSLVIAGSEDIEAQDF